MGLSVGQFNRMLQTSGRDYSPGKHQGRKKMPNSAKTLVWPDTRLGCRESCAGGGRELSLQGMKRCKPGLMAAWWAGPPLICKDLVITHWEIKRWKLYCPGHNAVIIVRESNLCFTTSLYKVGICWLRNVWQIIWPHLGVWMVDVVTIT